MPPELLAVLQEVAAFVPPAFAELGRHIPIEWLEQVIQLAPGFAKMRERKMPLDRVLWLVIGMAVFADRSIQAVASHLCLALPGGKHGVDPSALPQARARLGAEPLEALLDLTGRHWGIASAAESRWRGLSIFAADGTCLRLADSRANEAEFGRPGGGRSLAGYPQARLVALMAVHSHLIVAANWGAFSEGEHTLLRPLLEEIPNQSLTILDRGFISWKLVYDIAGEGTDRHWMVRAKKNLTWNVVKKLGTGDLLVEIVVHKNLRRLHPELPQTIPARVVTYRIKGYRPQKVITSLVDATRFPKNELAGIYHERWEIELGYDELKTHLLERNEALRSKTPAGVRQEIAGTLVAYNLVRQAMRAAAKEIGVDPRRMSFRSSLHAVRAFCLTAWMSSPGVLPKRLIGFESDLRMLVLPERRSDRRYDRTVKIKMSGYARNRRRGSAKKRARPIARRPTQRAPEPI